MDEGNNELSRTAEAISDGDFAQGSIALLNKIVVEDAASHLVAKLVQNERRNCKTEEDAVSNVMLHLESLGNSFPLLACVLMAHLWPLAAGGLFLHEVCDAIDLWIQGCDSPELARQIKLIAASEADPDTRRHYQQWLQFKETSQRTDGP